MMKNKKWIALVAGLAIVILCVAMLLFSCNGGQGGEGTTPTSQPTTATTEPTEQTTPTEPTETAAPTEPVETTEATEETTEPEDDDQPAGGNRPGGTGGFEGGETGTPDQGGTTNPPAEETPEVPSAGSENNPYTESITTLPDSFPTVEVPAGGSVYYVLSGVNGTTMTVWDADVALGYNGQTYSPQEGAVSVSFTEDSAKVQITNNGKEPKSFILDFQGVQGTESNPIVVSVDDMPFTTEAMAPNSTLYYMIIGANGKTVTVSGGDSAIVIGENPAVNSENGVATLTGLLERTVTFALTNTGSADTAYTMDVVLPLGSLENPAELVMGENVAAVEAENWDGYNYIWTAPGDGKLTITMDCDDWMYCLSNITAGVNGDLQFSDSDPVMAEAVIDVAAGDKITLMVGTATGDAGTITFYARHDAPEPSVEQVVLNKGETPVSMKPGTTYILKPEVESILEPAGTLSWTAGVTVAANGTAIEGNSYDLANYGTHVALEATVAEAAEITFTVTWPEKPALPELKLGNHSIEVDGEYVATFTAPAAGDYYFYTAEGETNAYLNINDGEFIIEQSGSAKVTLAEGQTINVSISTWDYSVDTIDFEITDTIKSVSVVLAKDVPNTVAMQPNYAYSVSMDMNSFELASMMDVPNIILSWTGEAVVTRNGSAITSPCSIEGYVPRQNTIIATVQEATEVTFTVAQVIESKPELTLSNNSIEADGEVVATFTAPVAGDYYFYTAEGETNAYLNINDGEFIIEQSGSAKVTLTEGQTIQVCIMTLNEEADTVDFVISTTAPEEPEREGSVNNPKVITELGTYTQDLPVDTVFYYTYTAQKETGLKVTVSGGEAGWEFQLGTRSTYRSDRNPLVDSDSINLAAGDSVQIRINTLTVYTGEGKETVGSNPAGSITVKLEEIPIQGASESDPIIYKGGEEVAIPAGATRYYQLSSEEGGELLVLGHYTYGTINNLKAKLGDAEEKVLNTAAGDEEENWAWKVGTVPKGNVILKLTNNGDKAVSLGFALQVQEPEEGGEGVVDGVETPEETITPSTAASTPIELPAVSFKNEEE